MHDAIHGTEYSGRDLLAAGDAMGGDVERRAETGGQALRRDEVQSEESTAEVKKWMAGLPQCGRCGGGGLG